MRPLNFFEIFTQTLTMGDPLQKIDLQSFESEGKTLPFPTKEVLQIVSHFECNKGAGLDEIKNSLLTVLAEAI